MFRTIEKYHRYGNTSKNKKKLAKKLLKGSLTVMDIFLKIIKNFPYKEESYQFSGLQDPSVHTDIDPFTLLQRFLCLILAFTVSPYKYCYENALNPSPASFEKGQAAVHVKNQPN